MRELSFNIEAARRYGVDGAILLQGMAAWISKNRANERHFHDGRWWTYNSKAALARLFPFWTEKQLRRIVKALNEEGALLLGNYSDGSFHNTTWYALSDDVLELLGAGECASLSAGMPGIGPEGQYPEDSGATSASQRDESSRCEDGSAGIEETGESTCPNGQVTETTCPNGQIDLPKRAGTQDNLPKESKSKQVNTNNPPIAPQGAARADEPLDQLIMRWRGNRKDPRAPEESRTAWVKLEQAGTDMEEVFGQAAIWTMDGADGWFPLRVFLEKDTWREDPYFWLFWQMYPRKIDKDRARRAWKKLSPARAMANAILDGLRLWKKCDQWQDERFIPHPTTWLNGRRWESAPPAGRAALPEPPEREVEEWT